MPEPKRPLKVFLCHASADKPKVRELHRTLKRRGMQPWLDAEDLIPGQNWEVEIPKALYSSDAIIICLTPNSVDKEGYVQKEIQFALDKAMEMPEGRIFIIPARLEDCELPFSLRQYQAVNLYEKEGYTRLMKALKLRASQLERATVELPKEGETTAEIKKVVEDKKLFEPTQGKPAPEKSKPQKPQSEKAKSPRKANTAITVALIGLVGTIIAGIFSSPWIEKWFSPAPVATQFVTSTVTVTPEPLTPAFGPNLTPITTVTLTTSVPQTVSPSNTLTPTVMLTATNYNGPQPTEITDNKGVTMRLVPAGQFTMGSKAEDAWRECQKVSLCMLFQFKGEDPPHPVRLDAFYLDIYEVTNSLYRACLDAGGCTPPKNTGSYTRSSYYGNPQFDNYPVIYVDWNQAAAYCKWRNASLPTEAQWEKAARGTDARTYPWGEGIRCDQANFGGPKGCVGDTAEVGSYESGKSPYGIYDLAGNVLEWVADWYDTNYYANSPASNPFGSTSGQYRVLRGGSWNDPIYYYLRASYRLGGWPDSTGYDYGFRCAKDAP